VKTWRSLGLAVAIMAGALAFPAGAQLRTPDCEALAAWAAGNDRNAQWRPNDIGARSAIPALFVAPATARLFGKPVLEWTELELGALIQHMQGCERQFAQGREFEKRNAIETMRGWARNNVTAMLRTIAAAREAVPASLAALERAPASPQLLRFHAALARAGTSLQAFGAANQAAGQLPPDQQQPARTLLAALRDLPKEEIEASVAPKAAARVSALRGPVRDAVVRDIGALPANAQSLAWLAAAPQTVRQIYAGALGAEDFAPIDQAIAARRAAIGNEAEAALVAELAAIPAGMEAFAAIDARAGEQVLRILPEQNAAKVRAAAEAQRKRNAEAMLPGYQRELAALPQTQESLDLIDGRLKPGLANWPQSAAAHRQPFVEATEARRAAIRAAVNRAEAGPLRGRVYEGGMFELEFVDRSRVFLKSMGQTAAGTYAEERDGRIIVTVNNQSMVLAREGRTLTGGPVTFRRTR
jgi:hypothetical protein